MLIEVFSEDRRAVPSAVPSANMQGASAPARTAPFAAIDKQFKFFVSFRGELSSRGAAESIVP